MVRGTQRSARGRLEVFKSAYRVIHPHINVNLRQLRPGNELARSTVDGLLGQLQCPFRFAFVP